METHVHNPTSEYVGNLPYGTDPPPFFAFLSSLFFWESIELLTCLVQLVDQDKPIRNPGLRKTLSKLK